VYNIYTYTMRRQNFTITELTKQQLRELKKLLGLSESDIVRRSIEFYYELKAKRGDNAN
jgi:hypothetical protein